MWATLKRCAQLELVMPFSLHGKRKIKTLADLYSFVLGCREAREINKAVGFVGNQGRQLSSSSSLWEMQDGILGSKKRTPSTHGVLDTELLPIVSIVGRPNVGKSALFNRLVGKRLAIVRDTPLGHVTRDYQEGRALLGDLEFLAVDTSGLEPFMPADSIQARATMLTSSVLHRSDIILFLLDGKDGIIAPDISLSCWFRESGDVVANKVVVVANKCESSSKRIDPYLLEVDAAKIGFGDPVPISAETGEGMADLYEALKDKLDTIIDTRSRALESLGAAVSLMDSSGKHMNPKVAIMGLTNVGKSTLINRVLQQERCLTGPEPGLTRDAISTMVEFDGGKVEIVDTAGWVKKTQLKTHDDSQGMVAAQTMQEGRTVLRFVHVVALVIDAVRVIEREAGLTHAEATLAANVVAQGRALIVVLNKMDQAKGSMHQMVQNLVQKELERVTPELGIARMLAVSAIEGRGVGALLPLVKSIYNTWNKRISTGKLNSWLRKEIQTRFEGGGKEIQRIKYISQVKGRPPTFVAFLSGKAPLPDSVQRFLGNRLREVFGLEGVPVRVIVRRQI